MKFIYKFFLKLCFALFIAILIPVYYINFGLQNFLWLSDIGLFITFIAIFFESSLLLNIAFLTVFPLEFAWNIDFFIQLLSGFSLLGITDYMFDAHIFLGAKMLSLFHIWVPIIWIYSLRKKGYDHRALKFAIIIFCSDVIATYFCTDPHANINWVFTPEKFHWALPSWLWLLIIIAGYIIFIMMPLHVLINDKCKKRVKT